MKHKLFSEYTNTYETVRASIRSSTNAYAQQNRKRNPEQLSQPLTSQQRMDERLQQVTPGAELLTNAWSRTKPAIPTERTLWTPELVKPQPKSQKQEAIAMPAERSRRKSRRRQPRANTATRIATAFSLEYAQKKTIITRSISIILAVAAFVLLALAMVLLSVRSYVVTGVSMQPTLTQGDKIYYTSFQSVDYGDIVIFDAGDAYGLVVKRVIGLPGDTIQVCADGTVARNLAILDEPYIQKDVYNNSGMESVRVKEGNVFLMGDNRAESIDSRDVRVGQIAINAICGEVRTVVRGIE